MPANREVLFDLHDANSLVAGFGLDREHVVSTFLVNANIDFVCFYLPNFRRSSAEMVLERIASDTCEDIHEPVVSHLGEKSLLVTKGVFRDSAGSRVGDLGRCHALVWNHWLIGDQSKTVFPPTNPPNDPRLPFWSLRLDAFRQGFPIPKAVDHIS